MHWWGTVLDRLGRDPMEARREVDWVAKLAVLEGYRDRDGLGWGDPRLKAVDLQWSDVRADRGLAHRMVATGRLEVLVDEADVVRAVEEPPTDTRAWFRGTCLRRFPDDVVAASWDSVIFDVAGQRTLQRVPMLEPLKGTKAGVGDLVRSAPDAASPRGPGRGGGRGGPARRRRPPGASHLVPARSRIAAARQLAGRRPAVPWGSVDRSSD